MDIKYVATAPARWEKKEWITFSLAALGTGAIALLDKPVWDIMRRNQSRTMDDIADVAAEVGGVYSLAALLPFYVAGEVSGDARMKRVALDGWASSLIAAGMISPALKLVASRSAPKDNEGTYRFRPFTYRFQFSGGPQSFPSGHAAQAFAIASVITSHYEEPWVSLAAYGIASITSSARLYQGVHFVSDLAAGTLIGIAVGKAVVRFNEKLRKEKREGQIFFAPFMIPGGAGVSLTLRID
jgi:membrane-associated phospholipid phosphatase